MQFLPTHGKYLTNNQSTSSDLYHTMRVQWKELVGACAARNARTLPRLPNHCAPSASAFPPDFMTHWKRVRRKYLESTAYNFYVHINKKSLSINFIRSEGKEAGVTKNNSVVGLWRQLDRSACPACARPWAESQVPWTNKQTFSLMSPSEFPLRWEECDKD